MLPDNTPILIGGGEITFKLPFPELPSPAEMMAQASFKAMENAEANESFLKAIDVIAVPQMAIDSMQNMRDLELGQYKNLPRSLASKLGAKPKREYYAHTGGNTPQQFVNFLAGEISKGESEIALLAGCENLRGVVSSLKAGAGIKFSDDAGGAPLPFGDERPGCNEHEHDYGLFAPINTYPLFENAIRGSRNKSVEEHMQSVGRLMSPFTKVASENPNAWFPTYRSPEELITVSENNRYVGFPYTKYLNSIIEVDMAASLLMCSVKAAKKYGIPEDRWVYLNGCADAKDHYYISERANYHSSPAINRISKESLEMANLKLDELSFFDLYSCFPSAIEVACQEIGIAENDPRGLTLTGGLPYFGGPGNNYVTHSIKKMLDMVRSKPGSHGMVTANGWHITKHSIGLYSTEPRFDLWQPKAPATYQADIDKMPKPKFTEKPQGNATVETYTVFHSGQNARGGLVIGRLEDETRFIANTPSDPEFLESMKLEEFLNKKGKVTSEKGKNIFTPL